jgi:dTDP-glucose 4,6-dehydratase
MKILITGGAGFIGSNFIRYLLAKYPDYQVINLDKLTYAGNLNNLKDLRKNPRHTFVKGDICNSKLVDRLATQVDVIVNFAAESHVDRSILSAGQFIQTDVYGTYVLLEAARKYRHRRYIQISTDEVYGSIQRGAFTETDRLNPSSPYAASKAAADLMVLAYWTTHGLPVLITRSSNNFGPFQHPEKFVPLFITNALEDKPLPLYGDGKNVRDWIYVMDNCEAIDLVLHRGARGEVYNIGGENERTNLEITEQILKTLNKPLSLIQYVKDRPGHDRRYALNCHKLRSLGFKPKKSASSALGGGFEEALTHTVRWYQENQGWWKKAKRGEFKKYYKKLYKISI